MTAYHPDTDREIIRMHLEGAPDQRIADNLAVDLDYVQRVTRVDINRDHILQMWNAGTGKREISARLSIPLTIVTNAINTHAAQTRRPPKPTRPTTRHERAMTSVERLLSQGDRSHLIGTQKLAARARKTLTQLTAALEREQQQKLLAAQVAKAAAALEQARAKLRNRNK